MFIDLKKEIEKRLLKAGALDGKIKINKPSEFPPLMIDGFKIDCIIEFFSKINTRDETPDDYDKTIDALRELRFPGKKIYATLESLSPQVIQEEYFTSRFRFEFHFLDAPEPPEIEEVVDAPIEEPKEKKEEMKEVIKEAIVELAVESQPIIEEEIEKTEEKPKKIKKKDGGK
jgi:hypothetical protein